MPESGSFSGLSDPVDPNTDDKAAVLPPFNYDGTAESYAQDSFAMDVDTDSSASHEDSSDSDSSIPDIESDYEYDTEPFGAAFGMDPEEWKSFDEDGDHDVPLTRDEMIAELEEMLGPDEEGKLWKRRNETRTTTTPVPSDSNSYATFRIEEAEGTCTRAE
ncbi:hypothetical protein C8R46DRAFT_1186911 [Mycena filopes]|nr:hypothetical protein C8R46DRAFT_1186911 [Mycena filopes]